MFVPWFNLGIKPPLNGNVDTRVNRFALSVTVNVRERELISMLLKIGCEGVIRQGLSTMLQERKQARARSAGTVHLEVHIVRTLTNFIIIILEPSFGVTPLRSVGHGGADNVDGAMFAIRQTVLGSHTMVPPPQHAPCPHPAPHHILPR